MASTLNLYALDVDSPTSRQLNIISETEENKRRNYLLTRDEKLITTVSTTSANIVSAINGLAIGGGGGGAEPVIQLTYPRENLAYDTSPAFSISDGDVAASKIVDVSYLRTINIFYRHDNNTNNPTLEISLAVMGFYETNSEIVSINELKSGGTLNTESLILSKDEFADAEFEDIMNIDNSVVLYSFSPSRISPLGPTETTETFNVIDLKVSGIKYIYVKVQGSFSNGSIVPTLNLTELTNVKIFACAQF